MTAEALGRFVGKVVTFAQNRYRNNKRLIRNVFLAMVIIMALPPTAQYWLNHVRLPEVSIVAVVALAIAAFFLLAFASVIYVCLHFLMLIPQVDRNITLQMGGAKSSKMAQPATEGSFIPVTDEGAWASEQFADLKRKGILTETDQVDIEKLAEEMGMAAYQKQERRNGGKRAE